jgi:hypothetical protein
VLLFRSLIKQVDDEDEGDSDGDADPELDSDELESSDSLMPLDRSSNLFILDKKFLLVLRLLFGSILLLMLLLLQFSFIVFSIINKICISYEM